MYDKEVIVLDKPKFIGKPISQTNDGHVLWEFPGGISGIVSRDDANYLLKVDRGVIEHDGRLIPFHSL